MVFSPFFEKIKKSKKFFEKVSPNALFSVLLSERG